MPNSTFNYSKPYFTALITRSFTISAGTLNPNITTHTLTVTSTNGVNLPSTQSVNFIVDNTPPVITVNSPSVQTYFINQTISIDYTAEDKESGLASDVATLDGNVVSNGQLIYAYKIPLGPHTFTVTATNDVGLITTKSVQFTTAINTSSMTNLLNLLQSQGLIKTGTLKSLLARYQNSANQSNPTASLNMLSAITNYLVSKGLSRSGSINGIVQPIIADLNALMELQILQGRTILAMTIDKPVIVVNRDDDNNDGIPDYLERNVKGETNLAALNIYVIAPNSLVKELILKKTSGGDKIRLWTTPDKSGNEVAFRKGADGIEFTQLPVGSGNKSYTFYVEAIEPSDVMDDVQLELDAVSIKISSPTLTLKPFVGEGGVISKPNVTTTQLPREQVTTVGANPTTTISTTFVNFTDLWVEINARFKGTVSDDNDAITQYELKLAPPSINLGRVTVADRIGFGIEYHGIVHPSSFTGNISLQRDASTRLYINGVLATGKGVNLDFAVPLLLIGNDPSPQSAKDETPSDSTNKNSIYDLDVAGTTTWTTDQYGLGNLALIPVGTIKRARANFKEFAVFNGERCSNIYPIHIAISNYLASQQYKFQIAEVKDNNTLIFKTTTDDTPILFKADELKDGTMTILMNQQTGTVKNRVIASNTATTNGMIEVTITKDWSNNGQPDTPPRGAQVIINPPGVWKEEPKYNPVGDNTVTPIQDDKFLPVSVDLK